LMESLKKSFSSYSKKPFALVWGSLLYIFLFITFLLAGIGIFLIYFLFLSTLGQELNPEAISTLAVVGIIAVLLLFFMGGINAALARAYRNTLTGRKTSLAEFYSYALDKAPDMFGIQLIREGMWLLLVGPALALYIYYLEGYEFMDMLIGTYAFFMTFVIHMLFTPAFLMIGAFGASFYNSLQYGMEFLRKRHIFFIGLYILFAFAWIFNFIPFLQIASIFFLYPLIYNAMIIMLKKTTRIEDEN